MSDMHQVNFSRTVSNKRCGLRGMVISVLRFFGRLIFNKSPVRFFPYHSCRLSTYVTNVVCLTFPFA